MRIHDEAERPAPVRACAACRTRRPAAELLRFVGRGARVVCDPRRRLGGRGLNLCASQACLRRAIKRGAFRRGLGTPAEPEALLEEVAASLRAALDAALAGGRRPEQVAEVAALTEVWPTALGPLVEAGEAPLVRVVDERLSRRVSLLASAIHEFTFKGAGVMKRPPKGRGAPPEQKGATSLSLQEAGGKTEAAPNSESA